MKGQQVKDQQLVRQLYNPSSSGSTTHLHTCAFQHTIYPSSSMNMAYVEHGIRQCDHTCVHDRMLVSASCRPTLSAGSAPSSMSLKAACKEREDLPVGKLGVGISVLQQECIHTPEC